MADSSGTNVFNFMSLRSPQSVEDRRIRHFYIKDETVENGSRKMREVFAKDSASAIGNLLFTKIICEESDEDIETRNNSLALEVLDLLDKTSISCDDSLGTTNASILNQVEGHQIIYHNNTYYTLKTRLEQISAEFDRHKLIKAREIIKDHTNTYNRNSLLQSLRELFDVDLLSDVVFSGNGYENNYQQIRNLLFENLYILYILRRITSVNLEEIIAGLQTLHTLEILAIEDLHDAVKDGRADTTLTEIQTLIGFLKDLYPEITEIDFNNTTLNRVWIKDKKDLSAYFDATPIIHPLVARLYWYRGFNNIKPIGVGDLIVVKQWLLGYRVGEIARIHNVMKGETNELLNRRLEKNEETFSFMDETASSSQTESQSADRFEVKKEAESVIKTDINVGANASFTYNNAAYGITTSVGGNFAYGNSKQNAEKSASNFARDIMEKAVTNIQNRSSQARTITKTFETEETNKQSFTNNQQGAAHTSGIYRWLDKKYKAQLFNYGRRLMFEFIVPEPAAFYVESKLRATEFDINVPQKPPVPKYEQVSIIKPGTQNDVLNPDDITKQVFDDLRTIYDLGDINYPVTSMDMSFSDQERKNNLTLAVGGAGNRIWTNTQYRSKCPDGYNVSYISIVGNVKFSGKQGVVGGEDENDSFEDNKWLFMLNGVNIWDERAGNKNIYENHTLDNVVWPTTPVRVNNEELVLDISFQDLDWYSMMVYVGLVIDDTYLLDFQNMVYLKIRSIEQKKVDKINQEREIMYSTGMTDYRNKINELNAQTVNDIIQGKSEAFNARIIAEELKKHCITMIAKEFDASAGDDILSGEDAMEEVEVDMQYNKFVVEEVSPVDTGMNNNVADEKITVAGFMQVERETTHPKINIDIARKKARYIQFLEQAFEWENIAYLFYPYFWAKESKWVKLMNRLDYTDNNMTAFLKAGSARVLIAVTPSYNEAVMHFLETRQPWEGGDLPVIGDPLFIPIYEEIRKQQDDLYNATAEGDPWTFFLPTSLVYLQDSSSPIPTDLQPPTT